MVADTIELLIAFYFNRHLALNHECYKYVNEWISIVSLKPNGRYWFRQMSPSVNITQDGHP